MPLFPRLTLFFLTACVVASSAEDPAITAVRDANAAYPFTDLASAVLAYGEHVTTLLNKKVELGQIVKSDAGSSVKWPQTHDLIYDMVSLLSAPGGESKIATDRRYESKFPFLAGMHGGLVEYYTRLLCTARGIPQSPPKYPYQYSVAASFCPRFPDHCWKAFMQNEGFAVLGNAVAAEWALGNEHCGDEVHGHVAYTMGITPDNYEYATLGMYSNPYYGPHLKGGWCLAVGDRENGICHPQCKRQCYNLSEEDQSVHPCFKYCTASTDPVSVTPEHTEL